MLDGSSLLPTDDKQKSSKCRDLVGKPQKRLAGLDSADKITPTRDPRLFWGVDFGRVVGE